MTITNRIDHITKIPTEYLSAELPAPKSVKIEVTGRCNYRCVAGDTPVNTVYGKIPIKDLVGRDIPVYTYKDGEIFISDATNVRKYGQDEQLVRVNFDDGTHIDCTPDHKFLCFKSLVGGGTDEFVVEAQRLNEKDRIRALRENEVGGGYINVCCGRSFRRKRYRLVMDYLQGRKIGKSEIVHHKDHTTNNDHPDNLELLSSAKDHAAKHPEIAQRMRDNNPIKDMTKEWQNKINSSLKGKKRTLKQRLAYRASKLGDKNPNYVDGRTCGEKSRIAEVNHKVTSVEKFEERGDVYCLEVPETGWFFANDVLIKNCGFCALRTREKQPITDMDFGLFKQITQQMRDAGVDEIGVFYLGESLMNVDLLEKCVKWCKDIGFPYVFLTSNASLATTSVARRLMKAGLNSLKWSVNAADEEQFKDVMAVKPKLFKDALKNIKDAKAVRDFGGYKCGLYASSIKYDGEQQTKMEAMVDEIRPYVDEHYWLPLYSMGSIATQREAELGFRPTAGNQGRLEALRDPLPCWSAFTEGHVTADGGLSACCFDADSRWRMGDLTTTDFMDAWNSEKFVSLRAAHLNKDVTGTVCEECVAY